jgi:hypothetical protein
MMAYFIQSEEGVTGNKIATATNSEVWVAQQIAIRPGTSAGNSGSASSKTGTTSYSAQATDLGNQVMVQGASEGQGLIKAYPNPVMDYLSISFAEMTEQPDASSILVVDRIGREQAVNAVWEKESRSLQLNFSYVEKGLYIIKVAHATGIKVLKVYKE